MDPLFHFVMSFTGGYILLKGMKADFRLSELFILSLLVGLIDIDHLLGLPENILLLHNLTFVIGVPAVLMYVFRRVGNRKLMMYSFAAMIMMMGHLLADMIKGIYGVPLFFPFYGGLFMMPHSWNLFEIGSSYLVSTTGIAVALYFAIVFSAVLIHERIERK